ncbi:ER membrane protein complex subunit 4 [Podochytrium sp. JEL0797]|nr:ER membrane protein complex subunit 4 [Podochytrium sp. JEL0797]
MAIKLDFSPLDQSSQATAAALDPKGFSFASDFSKTKQSKKEPTEQEQAAIDANMANLKLKKSWETAIAPLKQVPMQGFMLYMSGNSVQIYSIMVTVMLFMNSSNAILNTQLAFKRFETVASDKKPASANYNLVLPKIVYILAQCVLIGLGVYKCSAMGLLPTSHSDWLSFLEAKSVLEYSSGGVVM